MSIVSFVMSLERTLADGYVTKTISRYLCFILAKSLQWFEMIFSKLGNPVSLDYEDIPRNFSSSHMLLLPLWLSVFQIRKFRLRDDESMSEYVNECMVRSFLFISNDYSLHFMECVLPITISNMSSVIFHVHGYKAFV